MNYRAAYSIGFHPWEDAARDPMFLIINAIVLVGLITTAIGTALHNNP